MRSTGVDELGVSRESGTTVVLIDARYFRPTEVELLIGAPAKARQLGWRPEISFYKMVSEMEKLGLATALMERADART